MIRAFLAFDISDEVKQALASFIEPLVNQTRGVKWVEPKNYHVTAKFFGSIDEEKMLPSIQKTIEENLGEAQPVTLFCEGIGAFPRWEYPKVIWAGLKGEAEGLIALQKNLETAFEKLGFPKENREFNLHLTLARVKNLKRPTAWIRDLERMVATKFGTVTVDHLTLYKSQLTKVGSIYTKIRVFKLTSQQVFKSTR